MQRIWTVDVPAHVGHVVVLNGWLHRLRRLSRVAFLIVRDGRGLAQVVLDDARHVELLSMAPPESALRVAGEVVASSQAPGGAELRASSVHVLEAAVHPPPFELHTPHLPAQLPTMLDHAAIGLRHPRQRALWQFAAASTA